MEKAKVNKKGISIGLCFVIIAIAFIANLLKDTTAGKFIGHQLRDFFIEKLSTEYSKSIQHQFEQQQDRKPAAAYVLGGTQESLRLKFKAAAHLYKLGLVKQIMVMSRLGITEFSLILGRNLTNDEWALKKLHEFGVDCQHIQFIEIEEGFFGTLSEARALKKAVMSMELRNLILVCSGYHSRRAHSTFSFFLKSTETHIELYPTDEFIGIFGLLTEFAKLLVYENIVLPWEVKHHNERRSNLFIPQFLACASIGGR